MKKQPVLPALAGLLLLCSWPMGCAIRLATTAEKAALYNDLYASSVITTQNDTLTGQLTICSFGGELPTGVELTNREGKKSQFRPADIRSFTLHLSVGMQRVMALMQTIQQRHQADKTSTDDVIYDSFWNPDEPDMSFFAERISQPDALTIYYFPDNGDTKGRRLTFGGNGSVSLSDKKGRNSWTVGKVDFYSRVQLTGIYTIGGKRVTLYRDQMGRATMSIQDALGQGYLLRRADGLYCLFREYDTTDFTEKLNSLVGDSMPTTLPVPGSSTTATWVQLPAVVACYNSQQKQ